MGLKGIENGAPWLVKFQINGEHKEVCAIENCYVGLARECGIDIPATRYFDISPELGAFGVARFDREDGMRVPVLTLAGAMHVDFRLSGTVDYKGFLQVARTLTQDEREVEKAFARVLFNVVFNNRDEHPKNISFRLNRERQWKLSPAYVRPGIPFPANWASQPCFFWFFFHSANCLWSEIATVILSPFLSPMVLRLGGAGMDNFTPVSS
ncbi:HipA domain-containing protein [Herbaspirillum rubrisubalbicans M1]|uniref:HipA domain-containing protein n=1 Tax=Herbaspirillum rubrisubalbicans TaxID=80842 RepID=UPI00073A1441|nr:HipA domain-containing protein [Herbaspirillum rubrisubalbicans]ALU91517.1 HipA domain-containing protein [Herbaspirillum rubrisubalbicans M1]